MSHARAQELQRAERIGALPRKRHAELFWQRLRQDEPTIEPIRETQTRRDPERQAWIDHARDSPERRADHETHAERDAEHAEAPIASMSSSTVMKMNAKAARPGACVAARALIVSSSCARAETAGNDHGYNSIGEIRM